MKLVKVNVLSAECTKSDDEGANNEADVDRMNIGFRATDKISAPQTVELYGFSTSGEVTIDKGEDWNFKAAGSSPLKEGVIVFQDWESAQLVLTGSAREYDAGSGDEYSGGELKLSAGDMEGIQTLNVTGDDVNFAVKIKVTAQQV